MASKKGDVNDLKNRKDKLEVKFYPLSMDYADQPGERFDRFFDKYRDWYGRQQSQQRQQ
jgi:hypothetical protein